MMLFTQTHCWRPFSKLRRCRSSEEPFVYVAVDGTSLRLTDRQLTKDFGAVGSTANAARGLKLAILTRFLRVVFPRGSSTNSGGCGSLT